MAKIPLRTYNREIEGLIDQGQYDEAIAHCRHILQIYPKHIGTYRLLGKSYLESQRYGDAADVLQRVLSSVPEDFLSHVGMSIIREDEGNLDDAIWHMERAFEMQPANNAIQGELRRLYGRRDGLEPPKVRLTRGALARMYVKGNLYPQAIAELRIALGEDQQRLDLQALLAYAYALNGQNIEAAETCSSLIKKLPYCLEANRILADILSKSEHAEEAKVYRQRVQALDPYAAQVSSSAPSPERVPDAAVTIDKLDWKPGSSLPGGLSQPEWAASLGVQVGGMTPEKEAIPEWLTAASEETSVAEEEREADLEAASPFEEPLSPEAKTDSSTEEMIPDWMKEAGWEPSTGKVDEAVSTFEGPSAADDELAPAEIPDWLQAMAPHEDIEDKEAAQSEVGEEIPPWFEETPPGPTDSIVTWLEEKGTEEPSEQLEGDEVPEWFAESEAAEEVEVPDWLKDLDQETPKGEVPGETDWEPKIPEELETTEETEQLPDWLGEADEEQISEAEAPFESVETELGPETEIEEVPDWLRESQEELKSETEAAELPDWLREAGEEPDLQIESPVSEPEELSPEIPAMSQEDEDAAFAWLESLAAKQGADQAMLLSPEERQETPPEWVQKAVEETEPQFEVKEPEEPETEGAEIPDWLRDLSEEEAPETELISQIQEPEEEAEPGELPDWLSELSAEQESEAEIPVEVVSEPTETESLSGLEEPPISAEDTKPTHLQPIKEEQPSIPEPEAEAAPEKAEAFEAPEEAVLPEQQQAEEAELPTFNAEDEEAAFAWLESLAAKQGAEEALLLTPEERRETPPEWVQKAVAEAEAQGETEAETELPDWLQELAEEESSTPLEAPPQAEEETLPPEWIPESILEEETREEEAVPPFEAEIPEEAVSEPFEEAPEPSMLDWAEVQAEEAEAVPDLPDWLAEIEETPTPEEELPAWTPPVEAAPGPELAEEPSRLIEMEETAQAASPSTSPIDINEAGLADLESLPGIGFVRAQAIIAYRETYGPFESIDDLQNISGLGPSFLDEVKDLVTVKGTQAEASEQPLTEYQITLIQARNALIQGSRDEALDQYLSLIKSELLLSDVIHDLHEALYRFPVDVSIWQTLGDAYMRSGQLQEALDAYTKAEELIR